MRLNTGMRIGPYEIVTAIGAGGMGEVYRARDTRLDRDVALKILPASVASDPDRLMRFEREARTLAAFNHPNIATIHGIEEADGVRALAMELVDGEGLDDKIAAAGGGKKGRGGGLALDEALPIATQIAEALEAAHEAGIIHRDLKPANIKVRPDGTVKVLDFGLAKAMESSVGQRESAPGPTLANSPTITSPAMTQAGVILGTAAYMSPEQAKGRAVDRRADIWAFGCVLYEMLTGDRAFPGDNLTEVIAAVVMREPDLAALPAATPPHVRTLLARCFIKDPRQRLRDMGEARLQLSGASLATAAAPAPIVAEPRRSWAVPVLVLALVAALAAVAALFWQGGRAPGGEPTHVSLTFLDVAQPQKGRPVPSLAVSPDGRTIVYTARGPEGNQLWLRSLDGFTAAPIPGTTVGRAAVYSPDGRWIAYQTGNTIMKISTALDRPTIVARASATALAGLTWTDRDEIVFATAVPPALWRVAASGGTPAKVADGYLAWPNALPGGAAVLATTANDTAARSDDLTIARVDLETGTVSPLLDGGTFGRWVPSGHLVFARANSLVATTYDPATNALGETRVTVADDLFMDPATSSGCFAVSPAGVLVFCPGGGIDFERTIVAIDPGRPGSTPVSVVDAARYYDQEFVVSPDGTRLAAIERGWRNRIVVIDLERRTSSYLTPGRPDASQATPVWSPDGRAIAYRAGPGIFRTEVRDGGGPSELILDDVDRLVTGVTGLTGWAPDGRSLLGYAFGPGNAERGIFRITPGPSEAIETLVENAARGTYSPDGRWLAVVSARSGRPEVYVARASAPGALVRASIDGGTAPVWGPRGDRLYFVSSNGDFPMERQIMSVSVGSGADPSPGQPTPVAAVPLVEPNTYFAVLPDGRLLALQGARMSDAPELRVVLNWFDELRAKVK